MQANMQLSSSPSLFLHEDEEKEFAELAAKISEDFDFKLSFLQLTTEDDHESKDEEVAVHEEVEVSTEDDDDDNDDDDFSFAINGSDSTPISDSTDAQIRPFFPLFNRDLLLGHEDYKQSENRLPHRPPVSNVFIETPPSPSTSSSNDGIAAGPYCEWEKTSHPELSKKSNSTGFSKLWRFKEYMHRSHSDGRDAFVFLNNRSEPKKAVPKKSTGESSSAVEVKGNGTGEVKVKGTGEKKTVKKAVKKSPALSAHEVYLRSKGFYPEQDKRRSYMPYKPEVVGFFTNVNGGGLSKNVHPY